MRNIHRYLARFWLDRVGVAAVEFSVVFPVLMIFLGGVFEAARLVNASRHLTNTANSISSILATNTTGYVTYTDLHYANDSAMLSFSEVLSDSFRQGLAWSNDISISMAGISFPPVVTGCTSNCVYRAKIVWTGAAAKRVCGTIPLASSDTSSPTALTLPADLFTPVANSSGTYNSPPFVIVVDLSYTYTPLLFSKIIGSIVLNRSTYINPRYTTTITYSAITGDDGFGYSC